MLKHLMTSWHLNIWKVKIWLTQKKRAFEVKYKTFVCFTSRGHNFKKTVWWPETIWMRHWKFLNFKNSHLLNSLYSKFESSEVLTCFIGSFIFKSYVSSSIRELLNVQKALLRVIWEDLLWENKIGHCRMMVIC